MKKLKVNFEDIQKAMEDVSRDTFDYFLDLETGEVITFSEEILREVETKLSVDDYEDIEDDIEYIEFDEDPDLPDWMADEVELALEILFGEDERFIRIPKRASSMAYESLFRFIETVEDASLGKELSSALDGKGAFKRFKDVLLAHPKERKRWHGYNAKAMKRAIIEWLRSIRIDPIV